jgi:hypothetical protein
MRLSLHSQLECVGQLLVQGGEANACNCGSSCQGTLVYTDKHQTLDGALPYSNSSSNSR